MGTIREIWLPIKGFAGVYEVSNMGRVRRAIDADVEPQRFLKSEFPAKVTLFRKCKTFHTTVGTLVLEAFIGPRPRNSLATHLDGDANNVRLENLRWETREQMYMRLRRNRRPHKMTKLSEADIHQIRDRFARGEPAIKIGRLFGISRQHVYKVAQGQVWQDV